MVLSRLVLVFLAATLAGVLLPGCGAAPETGGGDGSEPPGSTGGSRPPRSTLSYDGETVTGALGTYCWASTPSVDGTLF